jgi:hypothetical protein
MIMTELSTLCGLSLDLDDVSIDDEEVKETLNILLDEVGEEFVWYRLSSSGNGLHIIVGELKWDDFLGVPTLIPIPMNIEEQMKFRKSFALECRGRRISDSYRMKVGMRTSRIFQNKNGKATGTWHKWVRN